MKRILSWNVNGIRAVAKKGFIDWLKNESPDILAIQETKAQIDQLDDELINIDGYKSHFMSATRKGYSGTALYLKEVPESVENLGCEEFDDEGRTIIAHFKNFTLINCYFPNSQEEGKRLDYKIEFCDAILNKCNELVSSGKNVVLCGDYNIAHTEIDLKNPKTNQKNPGFLPEEREWMTKYLDAGYADVFRRFHPDEKDHYTWWSYRFSAREKNVGWRIDYHCVNEDFFKKVIRSEIRNDVMGSDHCPVSIELDVD
jgi:exodeoxyribonuclease-3